MSEVSHQITLPAHLTQWMEPLVYLLFSLLLLWLSLSAFTYLRDRAYRITRAESTRAKGVSLDFTRVDSEAREAAIQRGKRFDEALVDHPSDHRSTTARAFNLTNIAMIFVSLVTLISGVLGAVMRIGPTQRFFESLNAWDRYVAILQEYKIGFAVAFLVIIAQLVRFFITLRRRHPTKPVRL